MRSPIVLKAVLKAALRLAGAALAFTAFAAAAHAESSPVLILEARDTAEAWRNLRGGIRTGGATLNKLQASAAFDGDAVGHPGFRAYLQVFKTNAETFSVARTGDLQTVSNIEAPRVTRVFELWGEQGLGDESAAGWVAARAGLIDLNRTFDSIAPAGLFLNASHGIAPDLSHSGFGVPSIFPASGPALQVAWRPATRLVFNFGAFAQPDPDRVSHAVDLSIRHGAITIGQADWILTQGASASLGVWRYTTRLASVADPERSLAPRPGVYGFVQGPTRLPGAPDGWVRAGLADGRVQTVAGYLGGGLRWKGLGARRDRDEFGLAVGHAVISHDARRALGLPPGETTIEATYSFHVGRYLHLQPDIQHIIRPAGAPGLRDATAVGLRVTGLWRNAGGED